jgi:hypothetical protein
VSSASRIMRRRNGVFGASSSRGNPVALCLIMLCALNAELDFSSSKRSRKRAAGHRLIGLRAIILPIEYNLSVKY